MEGLRGKRVVVTGGASGIGAATVERFIQEGSRVLVFDVDSKQCEKMLEEMSLLEGFVIADVRDWQQVVDAFARIKVLLGGVDILINNAGVSMRHKFVDITPEEWSWVVDVNLTGAFYVAQAAAKQMLAGDGGVILNTASTNGTTGYPFYADYNASKAGLIGLTRSMALELAPTIRVNAVSPGYVLTPMQAREYTPQMIAELNEKIPLKRQAEPLEIAAMFAFLASDEAALISGHVFTIDGGETAGGLASGWRE